MQMQITPDDVGTLTEREVEQARTLIGLIDKHLLDVQPDNGAAFDLSYTPEVASSRRVCRAIAAAYESAGWTASLKSYNSTLPQVSSSAPPVPLPVVEGINWLILSDPRRAATQTDQR